jgi:predicted kinase
MLELHLVRGLPGSGKSTFAKQYVKENTAYHHWEADMWVPKGINDEYLYQKENSGFYHAACLAQTFQTLISGRSVIVSNTFTQYWEMVPYIDIANRSKAKLFIHICRGDYGTTHPVPPEILQLMKERWEE